jgi:hypothetical protein
MKTYRKTATVDAKLFEKGDEDGFTEVREGVTRPYVSTLENQSYLGRFGEQYLCVGIEGEKWLIDREIFEKTYKEV